MYELSVKTNKPFAQDDLLESGIKWRLCLFKETLALIVL